MSGYTGFKVPIGTKTSTCHVDELDASRTTPEELWNNYIFKRKPVLINGHLSDPSWHATERWTDEYLAHKAGSCQLMVEVRESSDASYGKGRKQAMTFKEFLSRAGKGDDTVYLTTQKVPSAADGHPALYGPPLTSLCDDFPPQPSLMGHLVPQQVNIWMGCAKSGSSSGLHHDFHDNLYVLLRGRKRFRLWDPSHAQHMHTHGHISKVHPNGRIVYKGQGDVRGDGSSEHEVAAWQARRAADQRVAEAEQAVQRGDKGAADQLRAAEAALDALMEAQLEAALTAGGGEGGMSGADQDMDDVMEGLHDDYVDDDDDLSMSEDGASDDEEDVDESEEEDAKHVSRNRQAQHIAQRPGLGQQSRNKGKRASSNKEHAGQGNDKSNGIVVDTEDPPSFCPGVDLNQSDAAIRKQFPNFPGKSAMMEVWVTAGQMLYLPAGWFHEVTSFSDETSPSARPTRGRKAGKEANQAAFGAHLAFNYWFHPPDVLDSTVKGFQKPYSSDYWPSLWRDRCHLERAPSPKSALIRRESYDGVKVDELDGALGQDPHRGPRHSFDGVKCDELDGATGHDPHRGPAHQFHNVKVDEKAGAAGLDPHRGKGHDFKGVHVDELEGGTGHHTSTTTAGVADPQQPAVKGNGNVSDAAPSTDTATTKSRRKGAAPKRLGSDVSASAPQPSTAKESQQGAAGPANDAAAATANNGDVTQTGRKHKKAKKLENEPEGMDMDPQGQEGLQEHHQEGGEEEDDDVDEADYEDPAAMGELVAKGLGEYFSSAEGAGAFRLALGKFLLEAMAKEQLNQARKKRRHPRLRGRRHHKPARISKPQSE